MKKHDSVSKRERSNSMLPGPGHVVPMKEKDLRTREDDLSQYEDEKYDLGLQHTVDQSGKQLHKPSAMIKHYTM